MIISQLTKTQALTDIKQGFHLHGHEECHHYTFIVSDGLYNDREGQEKPSIRLL